MRRLLLAGLFSSVLVESESLRALEGGGRLEIPADLPPAARKALEEGIQSLEAASKPASGKEDPLSKAISRFKSAVQKDPKCALAHYYLGLAQSRKGSLAEARKALEKSVELKPSFTEALESLGDVLGSLREFQRALEAYEKALESAPRSGDLALKKGMALIHLGRFREAKEVLEPFGKTTGASSLAKVRRELELEVDGPRWGKKFSAETPNYRVLTPVSQEFADELARQSELIRRVYDKVFPDVPKPDRAFSVWVYENAYSYKVAGGPENAGGHYDPLFRKLVLYWSSEKEDTLRTLRHEAFHQYLHDYFERAPSWFNEGLGEYFSAFEYVRQGKKELMLSRPHRERLIQARAAIEQNLCPPAAKLMQMSQSEMYRDMMTHYAQSWAMIYYLLEGKRPEYRQCLLSYFKSLQKGVDPDEAYKTTFGRIDMTKFDKDWRTFILGLKT